MDEFTDNQVERMQDQWLEYRASGSDFTPRVGLPDGELCPPTGRSRP